MPSVRELASNQIPPAKYGNIVVFKKNGTEPGMIFPLDMMICSIGSDEYNHIKIAVDRVSKRHCLLFADKNSEMWIRAVGEYETLLNGKKVAGDQRVRHLDVFTVGSRSFRYEANQATEPNCAPTNAEFASSKPSRRHTITNQFPCLEDFSSIPQHSGLPTPTAITPEQNRFIQGYLERKAKKENKIQGRRQSEFINFSGSALELASISPKETIKTELDAIKQEFQQLSSCSKLSLRLSSSSRESFLKDSLSFSNFLNPNNNNSKNSSVATKFKTNKTNEIPSPAKAVKKRALSFSSIPPVQFPSSVKPNPDLVFQQQLLSSISLNSRTVGSQSSNIGSDCETSRDTLHLSPNYQHRKKKPITSLFSLKASLSSALPLPKNPTFSTPQPDQKPPPHQQDSLKPNTDAVVRRRSRRLNIKSIKYHYSSSDSETELYSEQDQDQDQYLCLDQDQDSTSSCKRRTVRFGPPLSPEIFDKKAPPLTPLKRGTIINNISFDCKYQTPKSILKAKFSALSARKNRESPTVSTVVSSFDILPSPFPLPLTMPPSLNSENDSPDLSLPSDAFLEQSNDQASGLLLPEDLAREVEDMHTDAICATANPQSVGLQVEDEQLVVDRFVSPLSTSSTLCEESSEKCKQLVAEDLSRNMSGNIGFDLNEKISENAFDLPLHHNDTNPEIVKLKGEARPENQIENQVKNLENIDSLKNLSKLTANTHETMLRRSTRLASRYKKQSAAELTPTNSSNPATEDLPNSKTPTKSTSAQNTKKNSFAAAIETHTTLASPKSSQKKTYRTNQEAKITTPRKTNKAKTSTSSPASKSGPGSNTAKGESPSKQNTKKTLAKSKESKKPSKATLDSMTPKTSSKTSPKILQNKSGNKPTMIKKFAKARNSLTIKKYIEKVPKARESDDFTERLMRAELDYSFLQAKTSGKSISLMPDSPQPNTSLSQKNEILDSKFTEIQASSDIKNLDGVPAVTTAIAGGARKGKAAATTAKAESPKARKRKIEESENTDGSREATKAVIKQKALKTQPNLSPKPTKKPRLEGKETPKPKPTRTARAPLNRNTSSGTELTAKATTRGRSVTIKNSTQTQTQTQGLRQVKTQKLSKESNSSVISRLSRPTKASLLRSKSNKAK